MKKVITFALVLAMTLALAAPALAITGETATAPTSSAANAPYTDLNFMFIPYKPTDALSLVSATPVAANKAYLNYENLYWKLVLKTNYDKYDASTNANGTTMAPADFATPGVKLSSDVVTFAQDVKAYKVTTIGVEDLTLGANYASTLAKSKRGLSFDLPLPGSVTDNTTFIYTGSGVVDKTAPNPGYVKCQIMGRKDSAAFKSSPGWEDLNVAGDNVIYAVNNLYSATSPNPKERYSFAYASNAVTVTIESGDYENYTVRFLTNGKTTGNNVIGIFVDDIDTPTAESEVTYYSSQWRVGSKLANADQETKDLFAAYNQVMNFFGFNYLAEGTLLAKHFASKLSVYNTTATLPVNLYTAVVTIPDETEIPKTGDNATVLGFVMVAAAVLAVVALGYKKVRE